MPESKKDTLFRLLKGLGGIGSIEGSAIVTRDGLLIASDLPKDIDAETFAAMSATMMGAAETAIGELKKGDVERVIVEGRATKLITKGAGPNAVLVAMVSQDANLGLILIEMKKVADMVEREMG
jgi:predicted regulator of Ras-like GTPase activity (Roadblock/LC7/MglB family)